MSELSLIAVMAAMMSAGQNCPLDPQGPSVVRIKPVVYLNQTTVNTTTSGAPPIGVFEVSAGANFVVELWAQQALNPYTCDGSGLPCDPDNLQACNMQPQTCTASDALGLNCVYADVEIDFAGASLTCNFVNEGTGSGSSVFDTLDSGTCTTSGAGDPEVNEAGGCTFETEIGIFPDWVKIRTINMTANQAGGPFTVQAREASTAVSLTACGTVPTTRIAYESWLFTITDPCLNDFDCSDGNACNGMETCEDNVCMPGTPVVCLPGQLCNPINGACQECIVSADCDDGNLCTGDICSSGNCINANIPCNDPGTICEPNVCNPATGLCAPEQVVCEDNQPCTVDLCLEENGQPVCRFCNPITLHLDWRPTIVEDLSVNQIIDLDVFATRQDTLIPAYTQGAEVLLKWDPSVFELVGAEDIDDVCPGPAFCSTAYDWLIEGFPGQSPLNDYFSDGDALYSMQADLPPPIGVGAAEVVGDRLWLTRFQFRVVSIPSENSFIDIPDSIPSCCFLEPGDSGHGTFCPEPAETCCVNLVDIQPQGCTFFGGSVLPAFSSVQWGGVNGDSGGVGGCEVKGQLGTVTYYISDPCTDPDVGPCGDVDDDGVSDDLCFWYECNGGQCDAVERAFADIGSAFGFCGPDGTADGNDRFHALNCFANIDPNNPPPTGYPCEPSPPNALNVDAGGSFGSCFPDGVCDGNDAFAALNAFSGATECRCQLDGPVNADEACAPGGPAPIIEPDLVGQGTLDLRADRLVARPGEQFQVDVFLESSMADLRGYQVHLGVSGGTRGGLELVDVTIENRKDAVFYAPSWQAFNLNTAQVVVGLDGFGVPTPARGYLATFTYQVGPKAAGQFYIDLLSDHAESDNRTFLFPTPAHARIAIEPAAPAVINIVPRGEKVNRKRPVDRTTTR